MDEVNEGAILLQFWGVDYNKMVAAIDNLIKKMKSEEPDFDYTLNTRTDPEAFEEKWEE